MIDTQKERRVRNQQTACDEIGINPGTLKSWNQFPQDKHEKKNKKYSRISLENLIKVLKWAGKTIEEVLN